MDHTEFKQYISHLEGQEGPQPQGERFKQALRRIPEKSAVLQQSGRRHFGVLLGDVVGGIGVPKE